LVHKYAEVLLSVQQTATRRCCTPYWKTSQKNILGWMPV